MRLCAPLLVTEEEKPMEQPAEVFTYSNLSRSTTGAAYDFAIYVRLPGGDCILVEDIECIDFDHQRIILKAAPTQ